LDILVEKVDGGLWVAAMKDKGLYGIEIDPDLEGVRWGTIYWAKVARIDKSMEAAFLELGHGDQGILQARDYRALDKNGKMKKTDGEPLSKLLKAGDMVFVQAKSSTIPIEMQDDITPDEHKLSRMSMDIAIPGRYVIYTPMTGERKISSRVKDKKVRESMMTMLDSVKEIDGCILRSAAANVQTDVLKRECKLLKKIWEQLQTFQKGGIPAMIMEGPAAFQRIIGDYAAEAIDRIITCEEEEFSEVEEWCDIYAPDLVPKVHLEPLEEEEASISLLDRYDALNEVEALVQPYYVLSGGGNIIIQATNALTAIDVNQSVSKSKKETNIEAAREIARQLRLRNIGGAIVIDFINMPDKKSQEEVLKVLKQEIQTDPCTVDVHHFTALGFVEVTRMRRTPELTTALQVAMALANEPE
jgi:Rne/Rng family ribonuclease